VSLKIQDLRSLAKAGIAEIKQTGVPNFNAAIQFYASKEYRDLAFTDLT
jgi:hypothetical protein